MPQAQVKNFPGFGIVYPGGGDKGIKVVKTFTQAPKKTFNPDGSVSYEAPPPQIHALFGGGFCYADGKPVTDREHIENISDPDMRKKGLEWFDKHGIAISPEDVVVRQEGEEKERPEPAYILSNQISPETVELGETVKTLEKTDTKQDPLNRILQAINNLSETVKKQGDDIIELKKGPPPPKVTVARKAQSEAMKARWSNPEFKAKMMEKRGLGKKEENA